jgi:hypothetical protein
MSICMAGLESDCLVATPESIIESPKRLQRAGSVVPGCRMIRPAREHAIIARNGLLHPAQRPEQICLPELRLHISRPELYRMLEAQQRFVESSKRLEHHGTAAVGFGEMRMAPDFGIALLQRLFVAPVPVLRGRATAQSCVVRVTHANQPFSAWGEPTTADLNISRPD